MICSNPVLDQLEEIIRFRNNLFGLCMSYDGGVVVVDHVALAPARFKKSRYRAAEAPSASRAASNVSR